jgi:hypothetical protein
MIYILENHIKIGCQLRLKSEWQKITEKEAIEMGDKELKIYSMKDWLLKL